jgi:hypothetical protein
MVRGTRNRALENQVAQRTQRTHKAHKDFFTKLKRTKGFASQNEREMKDDISYEN